ncbi:hypothetical protein GCM10023116_49840 [Kistimonas scapharcae]|uniref:Uncharacterized protein n=2 Tax=Kistimonas scapharcae TaxID=1036133 RepID=A0ABP8VCH2_9GAMM
MGLGKKGHDDADIAGNASTPIVTPATSVTQDQHPLQSRKAYIPPVPETSNHGGKFVSDSNIRVPFTHQNIALTPDEVFSLGEIAADHTEIESQRNDFIDEDDLEEWETTLKDEELLFADAMPEKLAQCLANKFKHQNRSIDSISQQEFQHTLSELVHDITDKGIDITYTAIKDHARGVIGENTLVGNGHTLSKLMEFDSYIDHQRQIECFDKVMRIYLQKTAPPTYWNPAIPFYRGGEAHGERKHQRNLLKGKLPFKNKRINRKLQVYGNGIYVSNERPVADRYASKAEQPTVVKIHCGQHTPILDVRVLKDFETAVLQSMSEDDRETTRGLSFKEYFQKYFKLPVILQVTDNYFLFKNPSSIESVTVMPTHSNDQNSYDISIHRLDGDNKIIGNPKSFSEEHLTDGINLEHTEYKAHGYCDDNGALELPVLKFQDKHGVTRHVAKHPFKPKPYWVVKLDPATIKEAKKQFILEPSAEFLKKRYETKRQDIAHQRKMQAMFLMEKTRQLFITKFNE